MSLRCYPLRLIRPWARDRKSTRLNSSHVSISYAVFCLKKILDFRHGAGLLMGERPIIMNGRHRVFVSPAASYVTSAVGGGNIRDVTVPFYLFLSIRRQPISTLFPYTTLFR